MSRNDTPAYREVLRARSHYSASQMMATELYKTIRYALPLIVGRHVSRMVTPKTGTPPRQIANERPYFLNIEVAATITGRRLSESPRLASAGMRVTVAILSRRSVLNDIDDFSADAAYLRRATFDFHDFRRR